MRSGGSLRATILLLLFLGLAAWALRLWQPALICNDSGLGWLCNAGMGSGGGSSTSQRADLGATSPQSNNADTATSLGSVTEASALPWPVADAPRKWSNFREGAYDVAAVSVEKTVTDATPQTNATSGKTEAHPFPWPIADAPIKWSNFREGAYSVAAKPEKVAAKPKKQEPPEVKVAATNSKTEPHPFPWPIAEKPRKWTNFRQPVKRKKVAVKAATSKTVPHPFPWPIAEKPRKWTNFRKQKVAAAAPAISGPPKVPYADGFKAYAPRGPRNALELLILRVKKKPEAASTQVAASPSVPYADNYKSYAPSGPRNALELLLLRVKKGAQPASPAKQASACGDELNRVARGGTILFETASARLTDSSYETLDALARVAKTCDRVKIVVEGHTDDRGSASFNQGLSERRAQAVAAYLQGAGIAGDSLSAVGYGESRPAVPNTSRANRRQNRRIEFSVSGN